MRCGFFLPSIGVLLICLTISAQIPGAGEQPTNAAAQVPALLDLGRRHVLNGEMDKGLARLSEALRIDPHCVEAYLMRSWIYILRGDFDRVIADCSAAIQCDPRCLAAYECRAASYLGKGDYDRSIADSTRAMELNPKATPSYVNRGNAYLAKNELVRALEDFQALLLLLPRSDEALAGIGCVHLSRNEYPEALAKFTEAIAATPQVKDWHCIGRLALHYEQRARVYSVTGEYARAMADHEAAARVRRSADGAPTAQPK